MTTALFHQARLFRRTKRALVSFIVLLATAGCVPVEKKLLQTAEDEARKGNFHVAISLLDKILLRFPGDEVSLKAAREAARLTFFETKDFKKAAEYQKYLVLYSPDAEERYRAQKQIADTYFTQLNDYPSAVVEINKLLIMIQEPEDRARYKLNLARAYYYQNNFAQADNEAAEYLRVAKDEKIRFELTMLRGNILLAQKELSKAVETYKLALSQFPSLATKENVPLTIAVCYEELKDYKNAIAMLEILKKTHPMPEYIDVRIKRLVERQKNAPGAKGARK